MKAGAAVLLIILVLVASVSEVCIVLEGMAAVKSHKNWKTNEVYFRLTFDPLLWTLLFYNLMIHGFST